MDHADGGERRRTVIFQTPRSAHAYNALRAGQATASNTIVLTNWNATLANLNLRLYHATAFTVGIQVAESLSTVDNVERIYQSA